MIDRVIWIVLDSVGMGEMPDAKEFGDVGANTIGNISKAVGGLNLPNMVRLGLGNIENITGVDKSEEPIGCYARFKEASNGKDTTTGHWEMGGVVSKVAFPTYPNGFPKDVIEKFEKLTGRKVIGNKPASGTAILDELGERQMKDGSVIVYTSADSVFQIAAHEEVVPLEELYKMCQIAREMLSGEHAVARVIARPFVGKPGNFTRTPNRRDFSLIPPYDTVLNKIKNKGLDVIGVGKIEDIFCKQGITEAVHTKDNMDGVDKTLEYIRQDNKGLIFTNLVDFDMKWGHRNDFKAYANGLEEFDVRLKEIIDAMKETDVLFITADHGCDPTMPGTDHSREHVPFLAYGKSFKENINLGTKNSFADMGQTVAEILNVEKIKNGESFLKEIFMDYKELIKVALDYRDRAYAPYSDFKVGAGVLFESGKIYGGCNIENASFGATNCAERTGIFKGISEGETKIKALAVVGSLEEYTYPCGICRQVIAEFGNENVKIIIAKSEDDYIVKDMNEILPGAFTKSALGK